MKPVYLRFQWEEVKSLRRNCPFTLDLSVLSLVSLPHHIFSTRLALLPWMFMSQQSEFTVLSPAEINRGVRSSERLRGWMQTFGIISCCQRGADLFLSSPSSARASVKSPICDLCCCSYTQSFITLFSFR